jgi:glycosyltransferase involved in cell wall biosynthesis
MKGRLPIYCFNWPSNVGGADTKFVHLLLLLHRDYDVTVVPNTREQFGQVHWRRWLADLGVKAVLLEDLPQKLSGWGLSLCNGKFWGEGLGLEAHRRGLRIAWSSEMMWHHAGEIAAARLGLIEKVLYVSEVQRAALEAGYVGQASRLSPLSLSGKDGDRRDACPTAEAATSGCYESGLRWQITGNYIAPSEFPWRDRTRNRRFEEFVIGRLSRPDPAKFPPDFPESYQRLRLKNPRYRVMAWSEEMTGIFGRPVGQASRLSPLSLPGKDGDRHDARPTASRFRGRWDLLPKEAETQLDFLQALDLFVYDVRDDFTESWGRAVVEAMLTGAVPLVTGHPRHHLKHLVPQGLGGFLCSTPEDWREHAQRLQQDGALRKKISKAGRRWAKRELCDAAQHRKVWRGVFED